MQTVEDAMALARAEAGAVALAHIQSQAKGLTPDQTAEAVDHQKKFSIAELATMGPTLQELYRDRHLLSFQSTPDEVGRWRLGYVIAHNVLRLTAKENRRPLPVLTKSFMYKYATFADADPLGLEDDFTRDYIHANHVAPVKLVANLLTHAPNRVGAMAMFGLYGEWANPARGYIPPPQPKLKRPIRSRLPQGQMMESRNRNKPRRS